MKGFFTLAFVGEKSQNESLFTDWDGKSYNIPQVCVDDYISQNNISFVHILHSDIQGSEYDMLLGCKKSIYAQKIGWFFVSTHGDDQHNKCLKFFKENEFKIIACHSNSQSFSADGLTVARANYISGIDNVNITNKK